MAGRSPYVGRGVDADHREPLALAGVEEVKIENP
jgi:hypothetical protein